MIFFHLDDEEKIEILDRNLSKIIASIKQENDEGLKERKDLEGKLLKVLDHIQLGQNQKKLINQYQRSMARELRLTKRKLDHSREESKTLHSQVERLTQTTSNANELIEGYKKKIEEMENALNEMTRTFEETEAKLKETTNKSSRIYAEFIVILGIFTTIIFATFGGLEISGNIFSNLNEVSTGKLMVFGSLIVASIVLILFMLLNGISKLTKFPISSCKCGPEDKCTHNLIQKHPSMVIANMILLFIFVLGITQYFLPYEQLLGKVFMDFEFSLNTLPLFIIAIISLLYIVLMCVLYYSLRKKQ